MPRFNGGQVRGSDKVAGVTARGGEWSEKETLKQDVSSVQRQTLHP